MAGKILELQVSHADFQELIIPLFFLVYFDFKPIFAYFCQLLLIRFWSATVYIIFDSRRDINWQRFLPGSLFLGQEGSY